MEFGAKSFLSAGQTNFAYLMVFKLQTAIKMLSSCMQKQQVPQCRKQTSATKRNLKLLIAWLTCIADLTRFDKNSKYIAIYKYFINSNIFKFGEVQYPSLTLNTVNLVLFVDGTSHQTTKGNISRDFVKIPHFVRMSYLGILQYH